MAEYPQGWLAFEDDFGGKQGEWRCDPGQSGGVNCLGDLGTHVENAVAAMTGLKIKRLLAKMDVIVPGGYWMTTTAFWWNMTTAPPEYTGRRRWRWAMTTA